MRRKPRGAKGRMASPAQMDRLRVVLGMQLPQPIPFEAYRGMMREHLRPDSNIATKLAAWAHLEKKHADSECGRAIRRFSEALHADALARGRPPSES
jgi:hypothetical protein